jgi:hypothetical protein
VNDPIVARAGMVSWAATSAAEEAEMTNSAASSSQAELTKQDGDPARRVIGAQNAHN